MSEEPRRPWAIAREVVFAPAAFFQTMPRSGGYKEPTVFLVTMAAAGAFGQLAVQAAFGPGGTFFLARVMLAIALVAAFVPCLLLAAGVLHLVWRLLGSEQPFEASYRVLAYTAALIPPVYVLQGLPLPLAWLCLPGYLYSVWLLVPISLEVHRIGRARVRAAGGALGLAAAAFCAAVWMLVQKVKSQTAALQGSAASIQALGAMGLGAGGELETLKGQLPPDLPGFTRARLGGYPQSAPGGVTIYSAQGVYDLSGGAGVEILIIDSGGFEQILGPARGGALNNYDGPQGYRRATSVKDWTGFEKYDVAKREGELWLMNGRMLVKVSGRGIEAEFLRRSLERVDLDAVAAVKP
jgi:hypothetical protein